MGKERMTWVGTGKGAVEELYGSSHTHRGCRVVPLSLSTIVASVRSTLPRTMQVVGRIGGRS